MAVVVSPLDYLAAHDPFASGKPYSMKYEPPGDFPWTNCTTESHDQSIEDIRGRENDFSVAENGFAVFKIDPAISYEDFDDKIKVQTIFFKQVAETVKELLGASRVQVFEHVLRKRHVQFPIATGEQYEFDQPTTRAHIDMTPSWASDTIKRMNSDLGIDVPSPNYKFINIWKPLRGPVQDWPLTVCDPNSVPKTDMAACDVVYGKEIIDTYLLHFSPKQKWYYLSDQTESEAWIFMQADSAPNGLRGVPHTSFLHPDNCKSDRKRESIEIRAIAYF